MQIPDTLSIASPPAVQELSPFEARVQSVLFMAEKLKISLNARDVEVLTNPTLIERGGPQSVILNELEGQVATVAGISMNAIIELVPENLFGNK